MTTLVDVNCGDDYTGAATLGFLYDGGGGYFQITGNTAMVQLAWGTQGSEQWTDEFPAEPCNGSLGPGTIGVRFRNAVPGQVAVVSAGLSLSDEPVIIALPG